MPFTISLGITVIIHLSVIIFKTIFRFLVLRSGRTRRRAGKRGRARPRRLMTARYLKRRENTRSLGGLLIASFVFYLNFMGASQLLQLSMREDHSTLNVARRYVDAVRLAQSQAGPGQTPPLESLKEIALSPVQELEAAEPESESQDSTGPPLESLEQEDCRQEFSRFAEQYHWSLVNYLADKRLDRSFENREKLASRAGISGYEGSSEQNRKILEKLFLEEIEADPAAGEICRVELANN